MWNTLEKKYKEKYKADFPQCIKDFLIYCGFESRANLQSITETDFSDIEQCINSNKEVVQNLKCCHSVTYKSMTDFIILPGHKRTILTIPAMITDIIEAEKTNPKKASREQISFEEFAKNQLVKLLKKTLINAANTHNRTNVDDSMISEINIDEFCHQDGDNVQNRKASCRFSCPYCDKRFRLTYNRFWNSGKITKHIKDHMV